MKKKKKIKKNLKKIFNSTKIIIITLILLLVTVLFYANHLINTNKTYIFSGESDYATILNGVVALTYDVKLLQGSDIEYIKEDDYLVTDYKIGYYVLKGEALSPLIIKSGKDLEGFSLKDIVNTVSSYNVIEPYHNNNHFTKENVKSLDNGLYFIIEAKTKDGEEILDKIELSLTKVSK